MILIRVARDLLATAGRVNHLVLVDSPDGSKVIPFPPREPENLIQLAEGVPNAQAVLLVFEAWIPDPTMKPGEVKRRFSRGPVRDWPKDRRIEALIVAGQDVLGDSAIAVCPFSRDDNGIAVGDPFLLLGNPERVGITEDPLLRLGDDGPWSWKGKPVN